MVQWLLGPAVLVAVLRAQAHAAECVLKLGFVGLYNNSESYKNWRCSSNSAELWKQTWATLTVQLEGGKKNIVALTMTGWGLHKQRVLLLTATCKDSE